MNIKDAIGVLESVKRNEIARNSKINKLCTNPTESIGAKALDIALAALQAQLDREREVDGWISYTTGAYIGCDESGEPRWADRKFYRCPRCRKGTAVQTNYCPNCGVRLSRIEPPREGRI